MSRIQSSKRQRLLTTRRVWILEILVCAALLMAGCRKPVDPAPELMIEHEIAPQPPRVGVATITLKLTDASGHPQTGAIIRLEATMSHAGMRPVFGSAIETDPGRYQTPLEFNMSGDWIVLLHLTLADGRQVERQVHINGVQPQ